MRLASFLRLRPVRILGLLGILGIIAAGGLFAAHKWQLQRTADRVLGEARAAFGEGRAADAAALFEQYLGLRPEDPAPKADFAKALDETVTSPKGRKRVFMTYEEALRVFPDRDDLRRRLVEVAQEIGRPTDAKAHLDTLKQAGVDDGWYWHQTARVQESQARYPEAADACETALRRDPSLTAAAEQLSRLYRLRLDRNEDAERVLEFLTSRDPGDPDAWLARARLRLEFRDPRRAMSDLNKAAALAPNDKEVLLTAGRCGMALLRAADPDTDLALLAAEARERLTHGATLYSKSPEFPLALADLEEVLGRRDEAIAHVAKALETMSSDARLQGRFAELLIAQGKIDEAEKQIAAIADNPVTKPLRTYLAGRKQMALGDWTGARRTLDTAAHEASPYPQLANHIALHQAECYRRLGQSELEAATYRRVLRNDPESEPARLGLASIAVREKRWNDALAEYRQLQHIPQAAEATAMVLVRRNEALPVEARDWREFDKIVTKLAASETTASSAKTLAATAQPVRDGSALLPDNPSAAPFATPEAPSTNGTRREPNDGNSASATNRAATDRAADGLLDRARGGDVKAALDQWRKGLRTTDARRQIEITTDLASELLDQREFSAAAEPVEWLVRRDGKSFATTTLSARLLAANGQCDDAARVLDVAAAATGPASPASTPSGGRPSPAARDARSQRVALMTLSWQLYDESSRAAASNEAKPCAALARLGERLCRQFLAEQPERLLILTTWLAFKEQGDERLRFEPGDWNEFAGSVRSEPTHVVLWTPRLPAATIARIETLLAGMISSGQAAQPLSVGLADFEALLGRFDVAEQWYRFVLRNDSNHAQALNNLAWMLALRGRSLDEARTLINRALAVSGTEARQLDTRGCVALAKKDYAAALRDFEQSLRLQPGPVAALHLARARAAKGDTAGANEALTTILNQGLTADHFHPLERPGFEELRAKLKK